MASLQKALTFDAAEDTVVVDGDPADAIVFAGVPTPVHFEFSTQERNTVAELTPEQQAEQDRIAAADADLKRREGEFAARIRSQFEAGNASAVDALVREGKVLPAEADKLKTVFNALSADELTFSADDKGTASGALASFLSTALPKRVKVEGERTSPTTEFNADENDDATTLDAKARKLMAEKPGLTFEAAIEKVSGGGNVEI